MRRLALLGCLLITTPGLLHSGPVQAATDVDVSKKQLQELKSKMSSLRDHLNDSRGQQGKLQAQLGKTESRIGALVKDIRDLEQTIGDVHDRLTRLQAQEKQLQDELAQRKDFLAKQLRAAYIMGGDQALKMLLNMDSIAEAERQAIYYEYFSKAQREHIDDYRVILGQLDQTHAEIDSQNNELQSQRAALATQKATLEAERQTQHATLAKINADIRDSESQLKRLDANQKRLQKLIEEVERAAVDLPTPQDTSPFKELRAKLSWPIHGKLLKQFGSQAGLGGLKSDGIFIAANTGAAVRAIHQGRVVFADWLRGFGLLVIIDHGQGYMSLYGSNQALYKQPGDWVKAGDTIASVGDSGGQPQSGLYFEIRHKGVPEDPLNWLKTR